MTYARRQLSKLVGRRLGRYMLMQQIGLGGMATVFRAQDEGTGREVALKVLSSTIASDHRFVRRFRREGGLVARLKHTNIVPVLEYGEDGGMMFLAMEYIEGQTLEDRIRAGPIPFQTVGRWLDQLASALSFAHEQGVIHRDIKPSNVLLDRYGNAHLGDFGLARTIEGSGTLTGSMLMGTPAYMSPEQARGDKLDARSDQYSFGVLAFQMFAGRLPFDGDTPMSIALMHLNEPSPAPSQFNELISPALERVILTSLAKDPQARFPSVSAMNSACQAALKGDHLAWLKEPPEPTAGKTLPLPAETVMARQGKGSRSVSAGLVVILLVAGLAIGTFLNWGRISASLTFLGVLPAAPAGNSSTEIAGGGPGTRSPAASLAPTPSPSPVPTALPVVSENCPEISLEAFRTLGASASWELVNGNEDDLRLVELLEFEAPPENEALRSIRLGDETVFSGPATEGTFVWTDGSVRQVAASDRERLTFEFAAEAGKDGYRMTLVFAEGCTISGTW